LHSLAGCTICVIDLSVSKNTGGEWFFARANKQKCLNSTADNDRLKSGNVKKWFWEKAANRVGENFQLLEGLVFFVSTFGMWNSGDVCRRWDGLKVLGLNFNFRRFEKRKKICSGMVLFYVRIGEKKRRIDIQTISQRLELNR
jgi:hypothetical protein